MMTSDRIDRGYCGPCCDRLRRHPAFEPSRRAAASPNLNPYRRPPQGQPSFVKTSKTQWMIGTDLAGYSRVVGNFTYVVVRDAGHMVPGDQPVRALDLITRFVDGTPF